MEQQTEKIKLLIEEMLEKMTVSGEVEAMDHNERPQFVIRTQESGILIGENGQNFIALNCLIKKIVEQKLGGETGERVLFSLDVNDYQAKKVEELKNLARMAAQRVRYFKKELAMRPMTSYERRVIHSALTEYPDIITESAGEGPERKVVIKPFCDKV